MRIENTRIPLTVNIVTVFLFIVLIFAGSLTWFNFKRNTDAALLSAEQLISEISSKTFERLQLVYNPVITVASQSSHMPTISQKPSLMPHPVSGFLFAAMERTPQLYSAFIGWDDGEFYQLINYSSQLQKAKPRQGAPDAARYAIRHIFNSRGSGWIESWRFLNADRMLVGHRIGPSGGYDPRERPWYRLSQQHEHLVKTDLYVYNSLQAGGITLARRFDGSVPGVFGVDLTLSSLSAFLAEQERATDAKLLIFSDTGRVNAYQDNSKAVKTILTPVGTQIELASVSDLNNPALNWLSDRIAENRPEETTRYLFEVDQERMIAQVTPIPPPYGESEYIAVVMSVDDLVKPLLETRNSSVIFTLIALAIAAPAIVFFSWRISRPLRRLSEETEAIREFRLDGDVTVRSYVEEVNKLSSSIRTMKYALRTFSMYVPKALVRRLVSSGVTPKLGGEKRRLTLLFTDVADFTTIADGSHPEELMMRLSEYFEGLSGEIHHTGGTIDKYIGDAVMAFWNAPDEDRKHAANACLAALRCDRKSKDLFLAAKAANQPAFRTRFGIHSGEAVVGNVGSSDRMDYTAIGSAVNIASRLEGLNKQYGTSILASEETAQNAGADFCFRTLDLALPKGAVTPVPIMELVGLAPGSGLDAALEISPSVQSSIQAWEKGWRLYLDRKWTQAAEVFEALNRAAPEDRPSEILAKRCRKYISDPPDMTWDAVTAFDHK